MSAKMTDIPNPFLKVDKEVDEVVKSLGWAGCCPSGTWATPGDVPYQTLERNDDPGRIGEYTLNRKICGISGERQVARLGIIPYDQMPHKGVTLAALINQQYGTLPDIRALGYIYEHPGCLTLEKLQKTTPNLRTWVVFAGSIVIGAEGVASFPCLVISGGNIERNGRALRSLWRPGDTVAFMR